MAEGMSQLILIFSVISLCVLVQKLRALDINCTIESKPNACGFTTPVKAIFNIPDEVNFILPSNTSASTIEMITFASQSTFPIQKKILETFPNLNHLIFTGKTTEISDSDFIYGSNLIELELIGNNLERIPPLAFYRNTKLTTLLLNSNGIYTIENLAFGGLLNLEHLSLNSNKIRKIGSLTFTYLPSLKTLDIQDNSIEEIDEGAFDMPELFRLLLGWNRIKVLSDSLFTPTPKLEILELTTNPLERVNSALDSLHQLKILTINDNRIEDLDIRKLSKLSNLTEVNLEMSGLNLDAVNISIADIQASKSIVRQLDLSSNEMKSGIIFEKLKIFPKLETVHLNRITAQKMDLDSIRAGGLPELRFIYIKDNDNFDLNWLKQTVQNLSMVVERDAGLLQRIRINPL